MVHAFGLVARGKGYLTFRGGTRQGERRRRDSVGQRVVIQGWEDVLLQIMILYVHAVHLQVMTPTSSLRSFPLNLTK